MKIKEFVFLVHLMLILGLVAHLLLPKEKVIHDHFALKKSKYNQLHEERHLISVRLDSLESVLVGLQKKYPAIQYNRMALQSRLKVFTSDKPAAIKQFNLVFYNDKKDKVEAFENNPMQPLKKEYGFSVAIQKTSGQGEYVRLPAESLQQMLLTL